MHTTGLIAYVRRRGDIVRTGEAQRAGWTEHSIRVALKDGWLVRPCRGWIALPQADSTLVQAARYGAVISCVTQAKRLGLWVRHDAEPHYATRHPHVSTSIEAGRLHWGRPLIPRAPGTLTDSLENVLAYVAACQPFEDALAIWESALQKGLVQKDKLRQLPLRGAAVSLLETSRPYADSGLETLVRSRLKWIGVSIVPQAFLLGHRVDFLISGWLVLQIDGGHHVGAQRTQDITHDAQLLAHGYAVVRIGYSQVVNRWPETQLRIMELLATRSAGQC